MGSAVRFRQQQRSAVHDQRLEHEPAPADGAREEEGGEGRHRVRAIHLEGHAAGSSDGPGRGWGRNDHERYWSQQRSNGAAGV